MNTKKITALFLLTALWGASFLFMRIASPAIGPVLTIELRVLIAGIVLLLYVWIFKKSVELKAYWKQYLIIGALNAAIPFTLIAAAVLIPLAVFDIPAKQVSPLVVYSTLGLAVFCTAIAYLFYFYLLTNVGPTKTLSVTFLVPVFGVICGMMFLHETISIGMIGGLAIILTSIFLLSDAKITVKRQEYMKG